MTDLNEGPVGPPSPFRLPQQASASEPFAEEQDPCSPSEQPGYPPSQQQGYSSSQEPGYPPSQAQGYPPSQPQGSYSPPPSQYSAAPMNIVPAEDKSPLISLICGILAWLGLWLFTAIPAIIFGVKGRRAARDGRTNSGGMATAGLWLGIVNTVACVLVIPILFAIAIPVFLNQRAKGIDAFLKTDLHAMATVQEAYAINNPEAGGFAVAATTPGGTFKAPDGLGDVKTHPGNVIAVKVTAKGYCVSVYNPGASLAKSPTASMVFSSESGGLQPGVGVC